MISKENSKFYKVELRIGSGSCFFLNGQIRILFTSRRSDPVRSNTSGSATMLLNAGNHVNWSLNEFYRNYKQKRNLFRSNAMKVTNDSPL